MSSVPSARATWNAGLRVDQWARTVVFTYLRWAPRRTVPKISSPTDRSAIGFVRPSPMRIGVLPRTQYEQAWEQPRYGLIDQLNGRKLPGTRLMIVLHSASMNSI